MSKEHTLTVNIKDGALREVMLGYAKEIITTAYRSEIQKQIDNAIAAAPDKALARYMTTYDGQQQGKQYHGAIHNLIVARLSDNDTWHQDLVAAVNSVADKWFNSVNTNASFEQAISRLMETKYKHLISRLTETLNLIDKRHADLLDLLNEIKALKGEQSEPGT